MSDQYILADRHVISLGLISAGDKSVVLEITREGLQTLANCAEANADAWETDFQQRHGGHYTVEAYDYECALEAHHWSGLLRSYLREMRGTAK